MKLNTERWQTYQQIRAQLEKLQTLSSAVLQIRAADEPYPYDKNASITIAVSRLSAFTAAAAAILADAVKMSDGFLINGTGKNAVQLSFLVENIWDSFIDDLDDKDDSDK